MLNKFVGSLRLELNEMHCKIKKMQYILTKTRVHSHHSQKVKSLQLHAQRNAR